jgi:glyoxylase-like metal-dependent hydrolase (beta-lactamase superfamily II)
MKIAIIPVTPFQQNCALLWDETTMRGAVIDPGGDVPRIQAEITRQGVTVERIALTHGHVDHAAGAAALKDALGGVPIEGPDERDRFLLDSLAEQSHKFRLPGGRPVTPDRWLQEGDTIDLAGAAFDVLHCPGHTPGHVVFVNKAARFAILGDVLFRGSVGRTDFPYCDTAALLSAIRTKLLPLGDDMAFLCGHGPGSTIGTERKSNPFLQG